MFEEEGLGDSRSDTRKHKVAAWAWWASLQSTRNDYCRCDCIWRAHNAWLRGKGVRQQKAIHSLRKESGSLIASVHGIEAARQHLGHRDIRTTSSHYVDKKKRVEVKLPIGGMTGKFTMVQ